jgi:hypothetical protein
LIGILTKIQIVSHDWSDISIKNDYALFDLLLQAWRRSVVHVLSIRYGGKSAGWGDERTGKLWAH